MHALRRRGRELRGAADELLGLVPGQGRRSGVPLGPQHVQRGGRRDPQALHRLGLRQSLPLIVPFPGRVRPTPRRRRRRRGRRRPAGTRAGAAGPRRARDRRGAPAARARSRPGPRASSASAASGASARGARSATQSIPMSVPSSARTGAAAWNAAGSLSTSRSQASSWPPATMIPPLAGAPSWQNDGWRQLSQVSAVSGEGPLGAGIGHRQERERRAAGVLREAVRPARPPSARAPAESRAESGGKGREPGSGTAWSRPPSAAE